MQTNQPKIKVDIKTPNATKTKKRLIFAVTGAVFCLIRSVLISIKKIIPVAKAPTPRPSRAPIKIQRTQTKIQRIQTPIAQKLKSPKTPVLSLPKTPKPTSNHQKINSISIFSGETDVHTVSTSQNFLARNNPRLAIRFHSILLKSGKIKIT